MRCRNGLVCVTVFAALMVFLGCSDQKHAPTANPDAAATDEDLPVAIVVLANDSDMDGDALTVTSVAQPPQGTVAIGTDGTLTYAPQADSSGIDTFTYTISDGRGGFASAEVTVTVAAVNDPPGFTPGSDVTVDEDSGPQTVSAWATDISPGPGEAGQALTFSVVVDTNPGLFSAPPAVDRASGDLTFTPADDAFGSADITVTLSDDAGGTDTSAPTSCTITVTGVNDPPGFTAGSDVAVDEDCGPQTVGAWATDISPGPGEAGQALAFSVTVDTNPGLFSTPPAIDPATGDLTFTPAGDAFGSADITVTLSDDGGGIDTSTPAGLTITVTGSNDAPTAVDDPVNIAENQSVDIAVLDNDIDVDFDALVVSAVTPPASGTASINPDNTIAYQPDADFTGVDSFTYTVSDGAGAFDTASVFVGICGPLNGPPSAGDDVAATDTDTPIRSLPVLANDTDPNWDALSVHSFTQPAAGVVTLNDDGTLFYTPPDDGSGLEGGVDRFTYVVHDGRGGVAVATVSVSVSVVTGPVEGRKAALTEKCHGNMSQIGAAVRRYREAHDLLAEPRFPPRLLHLVSEGYLPSASLFVCPLDESGGTEGGMPPASYDQFAELDEPGVSYMHEFSEAPCDWWQGPPSYITYPGWPGPPAEPMDTWAEVKYAQLRYGDLSLNRDVMDDPSKWRGYPPEYLPVLRCFWHADDPSSDSEKSISNLSFAWTIFLSTAMWETEALMFVP